MIKKLILILLIICLFSASIFAEDMYKITNLKGEIDLKDFSKVTIHWNNDPKIIEDIENGIISDARMMIDVKLDQGPYLTEQGLNVFSEDILALSHTFNPFTRRLNSTTQNTLVTIRLCYSYMKGGKRVETPFTDTIVLGHNSFIKNGREWSKEYLDVASKIGLLNESMTQNILRPITRFEFIKMIMKVDEYIAKHNFEITKTFTDCTDRDINGAYNLGIVSGVTPGVFNGDKTVTKEELSVIVYRYLNILGNIKKTGKDPVFNDVDKISFWSKEAIGALQDNKIVNGDEFGNYNPRREVTCEEATVMVVRILNKNI